MRMYWRMEAISIDVLQELLEQRGGFRADQLSLRLAARLGLVALRALCGSRLLCSGSDAIGRLKIDAQTAPRAFMCKMLARVVCSRKPVVRRARWKEEIHEHILLYHKKSP